MNEVLPSNQRGAASSVIIGAAVALGLLLFLAFNSLFIVREWEQVVVTQFGDIQGEPIQQAGLHFKTPFIQDIHRFEKRLVRWDGAPFTLYTSDRRMIHVNVTARWRIEDAAAFLPRVRNVDRANERLSQLIEGALRDEIGKYDLYEVVRSSNRILQEEIDLTLDGEVADLDLEIEDMATLGRETRELRRDGAGNYVVGRPVVTNRVLQLARSRIAEAGLGIRVEDILFKQLNYTREIESNVYAQMNAELQKISAGFRSHGRKNAEKKLGEMERELARIESAAMEQSRRIRGRAEAEAIAIYAEAYNRDPDFYRFLRTLEAYQKVLGVNGSLVISTDSELFELLKNPVSNHSGSSTQ
jgi:modulator of FtsH protease HflC